MAGITHGHGRRVLAFCRRIALATPLAYPQACLFPSQRPRCSGAEFLLPRGSCSGSDRACQAIKILKLHARAAGASLYSQVGTLPPHFPLDGHHPPVAGPADAIGDWPGVVRPPLGRGPAVGAADALGFASCTRLWWRPAGLGTASVSRRGAPDTPVRAAVWLASFSLSDAGAVGL